MLGRGGVQALLEEEGGPIWVLWAPLCRVGLEVVNGNPAAAAVWLDGGKSESLRERGSRVKKEMGCDVVVAVVFCVM